MFLRIKRVPRPDPSSSSLTSQPSNIYYLREIHGLTGLKKYYPDIFPLKIQKQITGKDTIKHESSRAKTPKFRDLTF